MLDDAHFQDVGPALAHLRVLNPRQARDGACASPRRTAKNPRDAYGNTVARKRSASTRCSRPSTRRVRSGQWPAPIQPLTIATTGNVTSSSASVQARMRSTAVMRVRPHGHLEDAPAQLVEFQSHLSRRLWARASGWSCRARY
jgi:hypothetical protein